MQLPGKCHSGDEKDPLLQISSAYFLPSKNMTRHKQQTHKPGSFACKIIVIQFRMISPEGIFHSGHPTQIGLEHDIYCDDKKESSCELILYYPEY